MQVAFFQLSLELEERARERERALPSCVNMAPTTSNAAKSLQQNRPRPAVPKSVLPAVPKSFEQRRPKQQQAVVRLEPQEEAASPAFVDEPSPSPPTPQPQPNFETVETNGAPKDEEPEKLEDKSESVPSSAIVTPATEDPAESGLEQSEEPEEPEEPEAPAHESVGMQTGSPASTSQLHFKLTYPLTEEPQESAPSETMSSESRTPYQMPPAFIPAHQNQNNYSAMSSDPVRQPPPSNFNGQSPIHHAHPNASGVRFGNYPESTTSSPAPPLSVGNAPPYTYPPQQQQQQHQQQPRVVSGHHGVQQSNGGHSQHMSNGIPPMGPPPGYYSQTEGMMSAGADSFVRRQMVGFIPDTYSSSSTPLNMEGPRFSPYDPPTPHSFQGSQSSVPSEQDNGPIYYNQLQTTPTAVINGSNGHIKDVHLYQLPRKAPMPIDNLDGLVNYVQHQFANPQFADYELELHYPDNPNPPQRIPGHGLMFARSPILQAMMAAAKHENHPRRILRIESNDHFLQRQQIWDAVQRLYGGPLMDFPPMNMNPTPQSANYFNSALAYAAAGHVLGIPPVIFRGVEVACTPGLLQWDTIEKALDFALAGGLDAQWTQESSHQQPESPSTYGPSANMLIKCILDFLVAKFPPTFKLDTTVEDSIINSRLPTVAKNRSSDRIGPKVMFGDFSPQETADSADSVDTVLSKVLLNLPFYLLKHVLESRKFGNAQPWATLSLRKQVFNTVIQEREKRRTKLYNNTNVSNTDRQQKHSTWQAVGWLEHVEFHGGHEEIPVLARKWVDYRLPAHQN